MSFVAKIMSQISHMIHDIIHHMKSFVIVLVLILIVDYIYLSTFSNSFVKMVEQIQDSPLSLNFIGAGVSYLLIGYSLYYFILLPKKSVSDAFVLGLLIYGVFDFTNLALFKKYDWKVGLMDTLWGGILFSIITKLYYLM